MTKRFRRSLIASMIAHALLLGSLVIPGCDKKGRGGIGEGKYKSEGENSPKEDKYSIVDKPKEVEVSLVPMSEETKALLNRPEEKKVKKPDCLKFFGGIGITYNFFDSKVLTVHSGYPAEAAGLQKDDIIISPPNGLIKGKIGTSVDIVYIRNGLITKVIMIRGKICTDEEQNIKEEPDETGFQENIHEPGN